MIDTNFQITFHCMDLFMELLEANNLNLNVIERSLSPAFNREQAFKAGEGTGKSGSFFFFSHDKQFIIKTMKPAELKALKCILPEYIEYLKENPYSMLAKIFGMFTLKRPYMKSVSVMLMENTLQIADPKKLIATYDLKGSTFGRKTKGRVTPKTVQKDIDFINQKNKNPKIFKMTPLNLKLR